MRANETAAGIRTTRYYAALPRHICHRFCRLRGRSIYGHVDRWSVYVIRVWLVRAAKVVDGTASPHVTVIQGVGGGGILSLPSIVLSDMVSLQERGLYNGLLGQSIPASNCTLVTERIGSGPAPGVTYSLAVATSAVIGGALANTGRGWRWIFCASIFQ